jgi:hypothetical protein
VNGASSNPEDVFEAPETETAESEKRHLFYNSARQPLPLTGAFQNSTAFLIAAGPSFSGLDPEPLRQVWTMTLNNACTSFRGHANCMVDHPSRFNLSMWLDPAIMKFVPVRHFDEELWDNRLMSENGEQQQRWKSAKMKVSECPNVVGFSCNDHFNPARWLLEPTINWGNHARYGGGRSVLLAGLRILHLLGFRTVFLLGVDLDMSPTCRYHFDEDRPMNAIRGNLQTYARLRKWMRELQPRFIDAGFVVKNCNPESRLDAFPFVSYEEALREASAPLGDYKRERTRGMYRPMERKLEDVRISEATSRGDVTPATA